MQHDAPAQCGSEQGRSAAVDFVRLLGIVAVVGAHAMPDDVVRRWTFTWHVPLFFFLSGYMWRGGRSLKGEIARRWCTLGRPYLAWLLLLACVWLPLTLARSGARSVVHKALTIGLGGEYLKSPFHAFWFVSCLFTASLLMRFAESKWRWGMLWLVLPLGLVGALYRGRPGPGSTLARHCCTGDELVILGQAFRRLSGPWRSWPAGIAALAVAVLAIATGVHQPLDMKVGGFGVVGLGVLVAAAISAGLLASAEALIPRCSKRVQHLIVIAASWGLVVILTHGLPLALLGSRQAGFGAFAMSMGFGVACALLASRSRYASVLLGRPRRTPSVPTDDGVLQSPRTGVVP